MRTGIMTWVFYLRLDKRHRRVIQTMRGSQQQAQLTLTTLRASYAPQRIEVGRAK